MKKNLILCILSLVPITLPAQSDTSSSQHTTAPFRTTQDSTLGMQSTHHYYLRQRLNPHEELRQVFTDAQMVALNFIRNPIHFANIPLNAINQYYDAFILLLYSEANKRSNNTNITEYERHLEAAVLYRTAYLIGRDSMRENEEAATFLLTLLNTQALAEERHVAQLLGIETHAFPARLDEPHLGTETDNDDTASDLPEVDPQAEGTARENITTSEYATWPTHNGGLLLIFHQDFPGPNHSDTTI